MPIKLTANVTINFENGRENEGLDVSVVRSTCADCTHAVADVLSSLIKDPTISSLVVSYVAETA